MDTKKIRVGNYNITSYSYGSSDKVLLLIHGGPGCPSDYLRDSHAHFADAGYRIISWDQLGCGQSDQPNDPNLWQLARFVEEVEAVRSSLNLGKVHILGQSWGGVLGLEYCLNYQDNVKTFIAADTAFDLPHMQRGFERKKLALGEQTYTMMALREAEGTTEHPEYQAAVTLLMHRHLCRIEKWPQSLVDSMNNIGRPVFSAMFGPYFFNCTGNIRNFNRIDKLNQIKIPVLLIHGEFDYIVPELACIARDRLPCAELAMLRNCSHTPFLEQPVKYKKIILDFLEKNSASNKHYTAKPKPTEITNNAE